MNLDNVKRNEFELAPEGSHVGILYQAIFLGHQNSVYQNKTKVSPVLLLSYELPDAKLKSGKPAMISGRFTASLGAQAKLRPILEGSVPKSMLENKDISLGALLDHMIGKPVLLSVQHSTGNNERTYANIASVMPLPAAMNNPDLKPTNPLVLVKDPDNIPEAVKGLISERIMETINKRVDPMAALAEEDDEQAAF